MAIFRGQMSSQALPVVVAAYWVGPLHLPPRCLALRVFPPSNWAGVRKCLGSR